MSKTRTHSGGKPPSDSAPAGEVSLHKRAQEARDQQLAAAMSLMREALALLDLANDADSSSVHLHLSIERLRDLTGESSQFDRMPALQHLD